MKFISIDFETANERRDSACAIGIVVVDGETIVSRTHQYIRPVELRFESYNTSIHGITEDDVKDAPTFQEYWTTLEPLLRSNLVVAHNASFDMSVLRYTLHSSGVPFPELRYLCSLKIASRAWPTLASHRLAFLAEHHGIELEHHNAESDAAAAAQLVLRAAQECSIDCALKLAERLEVSIGEIFPDGTWLPSSAASLRFEATYQLVVPPDFDTTRHALNGCSVAFTGTLKCMKRQNAEQLVAQVGGSAKSTVTSMTDFLVCGYQDLRMLAKGECESSKLKRAKELREAGSPIQIVSEEEFIRLLSEPLLGESNTKGPR